MHNYLKQKKKPSRKKRNTNLDADPLDVDDSHEVFMMDEGETPPPPERLGCPPALVPDPPEIFDMSNGTVVWA